MTRNSKTWIFNPDEKIKLSKMKQLEREIFLNSVRLRGENSRISGKKEARMKLPGKD